MDQKKFNLLVEPMTKWQPRLLQLQVVAPLKPCEYCNVIIKNQVVLCAAYKLGTPYQHFKHQCYNCKAVLFDGSVKKPDKDQPILTTVNKVAK